MPGPPTTKFVRGKREVSPFLPVKKLRAKICFNVFFHVFCIIDILIEPLQLEHIRVTLFIQKLKRFFFTFLALSVVFSSYIGSEYKSMTENLISRFKGTRADDFAVPRDSWEDWHCSIPFLAGTLPWKCHVPVRFGLELAYLKSDHSNHPTQYLSQYLPLMTSPSWHAGNPMMFPTNKCATRR